MFSRLENIKLGKMFEDETTNINDVEKALSLVNIKIRDTETSFRPMGDVFDEIASKWSTMNVLEQGAIANAVSGIRQRENFLTLMRNYNQVLEAQTIESESAGLAQRRYATYTDNLEAATNRLTAAFEKLYVSTSNSDTVRIFLNIAAGLLNVVEKIGIFNIAIVALSAFLGTKLYVNVGLVTNYIFSLARAMGVATTAAVTLSSVLTATLIGIGIALAIVAFTALNNKSKETYENFEKLRSQTEENRKELNDLAKEYTNLALKQNKNSDDLGRLLDIQTILNSKYGYLKDGINAYTAAVTNNSIAIQENIDWINKQTETQVKQFLEVNLAAYNQAKETLDRKHKIATFNDQGGVSGSMEMSSEALLSYYAKKAALEKDIEGSYHKAYRQLTDQLDIAKKIVAEYENYKNVLAEPLPEDYYGPTYEMYKRSLQAGQDVATMLADLQAKVEASFGQLSSFNKEANSLIETFKKTGTFELDQIEQLKKLVGSNYIKYLTVENEKIILNVDALQKLAVARALDALNAAKQAYALAVTNKASAETIALLERQIELLQVNYDMVSKGVLVAVKSVEQQQKAYQDLLKIVLDMIKAQKEAEKQALQDSLKEYKDSIDARMEALKDQAEAEQQALQDQLESYQKIINAEKDLLQQRRDNADFQDELANKNKEISDIDAELLAIQFDTSESANARRLELEAERAQRTKKLNKFVADKGVDDAVDALDREFAQFEEQNQRKQTLIERNFEAAQKALEAEYKAEEKRVNDKIKLIDNYLKESGRMNQDAMQMLKSRTDSFYQSLIEWNQRFGTSVQKDIIDMLETAFRIKVQLGQGGSGGGGGDRKRDYTLDRTTQRYINKYSGKSLSQEEWQALPYHKGGVVGGEMPKLPGSEVLARLLKGEQVSTDSMLSNFMMRTLPQIVANVGGKSEGIGKLELNVHVAGNLDRAVLPDLQNAVLTIVNNAFKERGVKRGAFSYSSG